MPPNLLLLLLFFSALLQTVGSGGEPRPNLLLILADDLGYGDLGCLNPERGRIATPHLDRLAADGMIFTDAHSGSSVCTPTRYGLLTGRYAWRTRLQKGVLDGGDDEPLIAADRLTLGGFLKGHGYHSACIGKWHLGFQSHAEASDTGGAGGAKGRGFGRSGLPVGSTIVGGPLTRGFDLFFGCSNARTMASLIEADRVVARIDPEDMLPRLAHRAVAYLGDRADAAKRGEPFFLYLALTSPHTPILPTPEWKGTSGIGDYGDFVRMTDGVIGEVLAALEGNDLAGNTLVIFTSDNGCSPQAGTGELERRGHFASGPYRGYKADIWEGGHRVPFFVRWPGRVAPGSRSDRLVCLTDLLGTCAELLGTELPADAGEDSVSFLPALRGGDDGPFRESAVHHSIEGKFAIREGRWKLNLCPGSGGWGRPRDAEAADRSAWQLYDLGADPGERNNLHASEPDTVARLSALLESQIARGRSTPGPDQVNDVPVPPPTR